MKLITLIDRMSGKPVQVTAEDLVGVLCDNDRDGAIESLQGQVEALKRVVSLLVDESPAVTEKLIKLQWRFER